ncbi:hypothetical protein RUND412_008657, partial [Rhizina undulata]
LGSSHYFSALSLPLTITTTSPPSYFNGQFIFPLAFFPGRNHQDGVFRAHKLRHPSTRPPTALLRGSYTSFEDAADATDAEYIPLRGVEFFAEFSAYLKERQYEFISYDSAEFPPIWDDERDPAANVYNSAGLTERMLRISHEPSPRPKIRITSLFSRKGGQGDITTPFINPEYDYTQTEGSECPASPCAAVRERRMLPKPERKPIPRRTRATAPNIKPSTKPVFSPENGGADYEKSQETLGDWPTEAVFWFGGRFLAGAKPSTDTGFHPENGGVDFEKSEEILSGWPAEAGSWLGGQFLQAASEATKDTRAMLQRELKAVLGVSGDTREACGASSTPYRKELQEHGSGRLSTEVVKDLHEYFESTALTWNNGVYWGWRTQILIGEL